MEDRFPVPKLVITWPGEGLERLLKSRVNPSKLDANNMTVQVKYFKINLYKLFIER